MDLPAHRFLDERQVPYEKLSFSPDTEKGAANVALALGYHESQMVKTLVFETGAGECVLVMLGGDKNAVSGNLKRAIGSIPPFHWQPPGFRTFVDACLMDEDVLGVGAGVWGREIMIAPDELSGVTRATVVNLSTKQESASAELSGGLPTP